MVRCLSSPICSQGTNRAALRMDLIVGAKKIRYIRWGDYFKIKKTAERDTTGIIYQLIHILTPKSWAWTSWCCPHAFRLHESQCLREEPLLTTRWETEAFCSLLLLHFLEDSPLFPSFLLFSQRNPVSPYLFLPLHLGLFICQVGPVTQPGLSPCW